MGIQVVGRADRIDELCARRGKTWTQLSSELHMGQATRSRLRNGMPVRIQTLRRVAAYFGVKYTFILARSLRVSVRRLLAESGGGNTAGTVATSLGVGLEKSERRYG